MKLFVDESQQKLVETKLSMKEKDIENMKRQNYNSLQNEFNTKHLENISREVNSLKEEMKRKDVELDNITTENNSFREELKTKDITLDNIRKERNSNPVKTKIEREELCYGRWRSL